MSSELFDLLFPLFLLVAVILIIGMLLLRIKRSGRSMMTTIHGAMYETYSMDKRAAVEQVLEQQVKKLEEQENDKSIQ